MLGYAPTDADKELMGTLDRLTADLLERVAQSALPDRFDREEESRVLSDVDKQEIASLVANALGTRLTDRTAKAASDDALAQGAEILGALLETKSLLQRLRDQAADLPHLRTGLDALQLLVRDPLERQPPTMPSSVVTPMEEESAPVAANGDTGEPNFLAVEVSSGVPVPTASSDESRRPRGARKRKRARPRRLTEEEARDQLIGLRRKIWRDTASGPSADGLLRTSMLDAFLYNRPRSIRGLKAGAMGWMLRGVSAEQRSYLPQILAILARLED